MVKKMSRKGGNYYFFSSYDSKLFYTNYNLCEINYVLFFSRYEQNIRNLFLFVSRF